MFSILWANPQGVTRAQMSPISGDDFSRFLDCLIAAAHLLHAPRQREAQ